MRLHPEWVLGVSLKYSVDIFSVYVHTDEQHKIQSTWSRGHVQVQTVFDANHQVLNAQEREQPHDIMDVN